MLNSFFDFTDTQLLFFLVITFKHQCSFDVVFKPTESAIVAVIQSLPVNICIKICIIKYDLMNVLNKLKFILHPSYPDQQSASSNNSRYG